MEDYSQLIREVVEPRIMETVYVKILEDLKAISTFDQNGGGEKIVHPVRTSISSNAAAYDKTDVNPVAGTFVAVDATWDYAYQHTAAEVHGIDISQASRGGNPTIDNLITDAIAMEMGQLKELIFDAVLTQWKLDIDSASTYSDAALNRTTYPTLASEEDSTSVPLTVALARSHSNAARLNKNSGDKINFQWIMETAVEEGFSPRVSALHGWNLNDTRRGQTIDGGYQPMNSFEGQLIYSPSGMTTGDVFYGRKQDFRIREHRSFSIEQVDSGRDSAKFVIRTGINGYVINPGFCGKMTNKT
jgi:hypothetical protein